MNPVTASTTSSTEPMRAVTQDRYGNFEVLHLTQVPRPTASDDQVLIQVHAAGLDRGTEHLMTGKPYAARLAAGLRRPRSPVPGRDVAGTVVDVGAQVALFAAGDEVYGVAPGSFAEYAVTREDKLAPKPANLSFAEAAVVPISAGTALQALTDAGKVRPGQTVLVTGASGGVGSYAVQLARALGAEVTGLCSTAKLDYVTALGAHHVLDRTRTDWADGTRRYDLILDIAGNPPIPRLRRALAPRGTVVFVGGEQRRHPHWDEPAAARRAPLTLPQTAARRAPGPRTRHRLQANSPGSSRPASSAATLDRTYPLEQATEAMRLCKTERSAARSPSRCDAGPGPARPDQPDRPRARGMTPCQVEQLRRQMVTGGLTARGVRRTSAAATSSSQTHLRT